MKVTVDGTTHSVDLSAEEAVVDGDPFAIRKVPHGDYVTVFVAGKPYQVEPQKQDETTWRVIVDGKIYEVSAELGGRAAARRVKTAATKGHAHEVAAAGAITAMMPGMVMKVLVKEGDTVEPGTVLLTIEAMKMENEIRSDRAGTVKQVAVAPGKTVNAGDALVVVE